MSDKDLIPRPEQENGRDERPDSSDVHNVPKKATDPFAPEGMPLALLEFHSPTRALVNMPATPSAQYIVWIVGCLLLASLAGIAFFPVNKVVSITGRMISTQPTVLIQPFESAIIRSLNADVGDFVHKGQVLARLDSTVSQADIDNLVQQIQSLQTEVARLQTEAAGQDYEPDINVPSSVEQGKLFLRRKNDYHAHMEDFGQRIAGMESDLQGARANTAMFTSKLRIVTAVLEMRRREQEEQVGSRLSTLGAQDAVMDTERQLITSQQTANATANKLAALKATRESYVQNWKTEVYAELTKAERKLDEVKSDYRKARMRQRLIVLRAPEDGIVLTTGPFSIGSVVEAGTRVMTLVPTRSGMEVEAVMRAQDSGFVKQGDHALIKFITFPYDLYGGANATVRLISADSFMPTDAASSNIKAGIDPKSLAGVKGAPVFYRVRLRIDRYTLHGQPSFFHPAPGVPVTADIDVGKRTILKYLFSRIVPTVSDGMREPS